MVKVIEERSLDSKMVRLTSPKIEYVYLTAHAGLEAVSGPPDTAGIRLVRSHSQVVP